MGTTGSWRRFVILALLHQVRDAIIWLGFGPRGTASLSFDQRLAVYDKFCDNLVAAVNRTATRERLLPLLHHELRQ